MDKVDPDDGKTIVFVGQNSQTDFNSRHACPQCGLQVPLSVTKCPQDGTALADTFGEGRKLVGNYEFLEFIGSGGMGVIYKARHPVLKRLVAVKMLHSHLMNEQIVKRFQHEAQAVSGLSHANVFGVHDFGLSAHGQPYMVMDFIEGKPLSEILRSGPLGLVPVINIAIQLAEGLQHAHEHGVLHRDLKPSNIMVTDADCDFPEAKIVDFGIAKIMETESTRVTQPGEVIAKMLAKEPVDRFQSMNAFLQEAIEVQKIVAQREKSKRSFWRFLKLNREQRHLLVLSIAAAFTLIGVASSTLFSAKLIEDKAREKAPTAEPAAAQPAPKTITKVINGIPPERVFEFVATDDRELIKQYVPGDRVDSRFIKKFLSRDIYLDYLDCRYGRVNDRDLTVIANQKNLACLRLQRTQITDQGLLAPKELPVLKEIFLDETSITSEAVKNLSLIKPLTVVSLGMTSIGDAGLEHLKLLPYLQVLHLWNFPVTDKSMRIIAQLKMLTSLNLGACENIPDASFSRLAALAQLQSLKLEETSTTDATMQYICKIKSLEEIDLGATAVTIEGIKQLRKLPHFHSLIFREAPINEGWIPVLSRFPSLIKLGFSNSGINDATLALLPKLMPKVENLDLENCKGVTDKGLASIKKLKKLFYVKLKGTSVSPQAVAEYQSHLPNPTTKVDC